MRGTIQTLKFLVMAPFLVAFLFVINLMTWNGHWWVQWAALGIGIAWIINLVLFVGRAIMLAGGLAALGAILYRRR